MTDVLKELVLEILDEHGGEIADEYGVPRHIAEAFGIPWELPPTGDLRLLYVAISLLEEEGEITCDRTAGVSAEKGNRILAVRRRKA